MPKITRFAIKGLYGERDIEIPFEDNVKILVSENGQGKTTILNIFNYLISCNFERLNLVDFESIEIDMNGKNHFFSKKDLHKFLFDLFHRTKLDFITNKIKLSKLNILYLPTFRRIESNLNYFQFQDEEKLIDTNKSLINFGMNDVIETFEKITREIKQSLTEEFAKINGEMLGQLISGFQIDEQSKEIIKNKESIKIILNRIGNNIKEKQKDKILELIETNEILNGQHDSLIYMISNLYKVYEPQKEKDLAIQKFAQVCNKYLVDKEIKYNEGKVSIDIIRKKNNKSVDIETLSSGEKHIVSLFCYLYLKDSKNLTIIFDEPEISLSMEWQKMLLPDILESGKCDFLLAATHSPFIFGNELISKTSDLSLYIKEL